MTWNSEWKILSYWGHLSNFIYLKLFIYMISLWFNYRILVNTVPLNCKNSSWKSDFNLQEFVAELEERGYGVCTVLSRRAGREHLSVIRVVCNGRQQQQYNSKPSWCFQIRAIITWWSHSPRRYWWTDCCTAGIYISHFNKRVTHVDLIVFGFLASNRTFFKLTESVKISHTLIKKYDISLV